MTEVTKIVKDKSTLAKLLAGEDLNVVYGKVETASFDVQSRTLTLPIFKEMSEDVMDLLTLHEVGHALFTPMEMLEKIKNTKIPFGILNILEDVRIEKMIQDKYLGAVRNFKNGYKELISKDFFKISGRDLGSYSLVDRINLKSKHVPDVPMSDEDMVWYKKALECKTHEDVLALSEEIYGYMKDQEPETDNHVQLGMSDQNNEEQKDNSPEDTMPSVGDEGDEEEENLENGQGGDSNESNDTEETEKSPSGDTSNPQDESSESSETEENEEEPSEDPSSSYGETDSSLGDSLIDAVDKTAPNIENVTVPEVNDSIIRTRAEIIADMEKHYSHRIKMNGDGKEAIRYLQNCKDDFAKFRKENKKSISLMVKEFEMKKAADQYARASVAKTGSLNMNAIHQYKFNDDLFNRVTSIPDAKSHGLVMYLDWSGSMCGNIHATLKQVITLTMFCDAVQIPYRVYAFSDGYSHDFDTSDNPEVQDPKIGDLVINQLDLFEFASSENSKKQQIELYEWVWTMTDFYNDYKKPFHAKKFTIGPPNNYRLSATPLDASIIAGMTLIPKFKSMYDLQKVQLVLLTDGASHACREFFCEKKLAEDGSTVWYKHYYRTDVSYYKQYKAYLKDPKSGYQVELIDQNFGNTQRLLSLLKKKVEGLNVINFHLVETNKTGTVRKSRVEDTLNYISDRLFRSWDSDELKKAMKDLRNHNSASVKMKYLTAIDAYFILPGGSALSIDNEDALDKVETGATKAQLRKAFVKSNKQKSISRPLLSEFMDLVA
tara:strand:- start:634 stop:2955 length:2322 start_codon:yes stop_codon:yes gene_type:complete